MDALRRHRRQRLLRDRPGDPPASRTGVEDFVVLERGDGVGGTWHYNTYPGLRLRRAVAPLLVLVRAQPGLDRAPTRASPRSATTCERVADEFGVRAKVRLELRGRRGAAWDEDARRWALETSQGAVRARGAGLRHRAAGRAEDPGLPGPRRRSRARRSTPPAGTTPSTCSGKRVAAIGTGASAIQYVPAIAPRGRAAARRSSAPRRGSCRTARRPITRLRAAPLPARSRPLQRLVRGGDLRGARAARARLRQAPAADEAARADRPPAHAQRSSQDPELLAKVDARLHARLQAHPAVQPLVSGARARQRRARHRRRRGGRARTRSSPPTAREREVDAIIFGTGFHVTDMPVGRMVRGPRRPHARRRLGRQPARPPRRDGARASRTCSSCSARTPASGTARWST